MISIDSDEIKNILPPSIKNDKKIKALTYAITNQIKKLILSVNEVLIFPRIDELSEGILTELAKDFHVDYWNKDWDIETKRFFVKNAFIMHRQRGTLGDMKSAISNVFSEVLITETNSCYRFKLDASPDIAGEAINMALALKNARSQLLYNLNDFETENESYIGTYANIVTKIIIDLGG